MSHLGRLVDDLLDVARITRGQVELKEANVDLADVVAHAVEVASPLLEERAHVVVVDVERGLVVRGDPARLTQVFSNLLTNAGKYTPPGGRITVGAHVDGADIVARVSDTGVGIAPEIMPQIFDRFVQGRQSLDRAQGGLGLGLSIVKSLVERHGGQVSAHSDGVGKGAAITVRLPRLEGPAAPAERPAPAARSLALKVLVVDDNEDAAELLSVALEMQGCVVRVAHDGPAALAVAANETFDAALLDIGLPVMDGYELVARLRELTTCASTRLVAVTGYGQEADRKRALAAGFHEHLVKPVDLAVLEGILALLARAR